MLLCVWWVGSRRGASSQAAPSERGGVGIGPVPVVAGKVEQKDVPIYLDGLGTVQAFNTVTVQTRVDGELDQVRFQGRAGCENRRPAGGDRSASVSGRA